ncbi:MAG TPA: hypothetical protein VFZ80_00310 [Acidimicrobiia bacterium]
MSPTRRTFDETDDERRPLQLGDRYEIVHGPASSPERTTDGVLVDIDQTKKTYTFELEDGSRISVADDEIDGVRRLAGDR